MEIEVLLRPEKNLDNGIMEEWNIGRIVLKRI